MSTHEGLAWVDGQIVSLREARVPLLDRAFLYGDSVFEVYRTYDGHPAKFEAHLARLFKSAERIRVRPTVTGERMREPLLALQAQALEAFGTDIYMRIVLSRGAGPIRYHLDELGETPWFAMATPLRRFPEKHYEDGVEVALMPASRPGDNAFARYTKASNYLVNILAIDDAQQAGAVEAIFLGPGGEVLEGATSNIFWRRGDTLHTPTPRLPILDGITRQSVLAVAKGLGLSVNEGLYFPPALYDAEEVFITSSLKEVMPVVSLDGRPVADGQVGRFAAPLRQAYLAHVARG